MAKTPAAQGDTDSGKKDQPKGDEQPKGDQKPKAGEAPKGEEKPAGEEPPKGEEKPAAEKGGPKNNGTPKEEAEAQAPETYELVLPEKSHLDAADLKATESLARAMGWSNDQAQQWLEAQAVGAKTQTEAFLAEVNADPTYGGDKLAESQQLANAGIDWVFAKGTPENAELRALLDKTGYGNKLIVLKAFGKIGRATQEDQPLGRTGVTDGGPNRPAEDVLYGKPAAKT